MIEVYCGLPGSGKSYALTYLAYKYIKRGKTVFTNFPVRGAYKVNVADLKEYELPQNSMILIDEAGLYYNTRDWKNFDKESFILFTQHRKKGLDLILAVQSPKRVDISIREVVNYYHWATSPFLVPYFKYYTYIDAEEVRTDKHLRSFRYFKLKRVFDLYNTMHEHQNRNQKETLTFEQWDLAPLPKKTNLLERIKQKRKRKKQEENEQFENLSEENKTFWGADNDEQ